MMPGRARGWFGDVAGVQAATSPEKASSQSSPHGEDRWDDWAGGRKWEETGWGGCIELQVAVRTVPGLTGRAHWDVPDPISQRCLWSQRSVGWESSQQ